MVVVVVVVLVVLVVVVVPKQFLLLQLHVLPDLLPFRRYCCWYFRHRLSPAHTAWGLLPMNYMTQILILFVSHLFDLDSGL